MTRKVFKRLRGGENMFCVTHKLGNQNQWKGKHPGCKEPNETAIAIRQTKNPRFPCGKAGVWCF